MKLCELCGFPQVVFWSQAQHDKRRAEHGRDEDVCESFHGFYGAVGGSTGDVHGESHEKPAFLGGLYRILHETPPHEKRMDIPRVAIVGNR